MAGNHVLLETIELTQSAASVTFDNIPQSGYTDLKLVASVRDDFASVSVNLGMRINGSSTGLAGRVLFGTGSSASSTTVTDGIGYTVGTSGTANTYSSTEIYIPNYRVTGQNKSYSANSAAESNTTTVYMQMLAGLWSNNAAITSITLYPQNATNMVAGSTFSLYGLAQVGTTPAIAPKADGGNVIGTDGTYWYHQFNTNGTFTPQVGLTCDYLVVAGGGGGAGVGGAGAGAGGLRSTVNNTGGGGVLETALSVTSGVPLTVTIGAGGTGGDTSTGVGTSGANSTFSTITSTGGGGARAGLAGLSGGSGGGAGASGVGAGAGTANQGFAGGSTVDGLPGRASGGGGGAGAVGANGVAGQAGVGGVGVSVSITGSATFYAGGGGGGLDAASGSSGAGGNGGGGAAAAARTANNATAGTVNTGGGGGGSSGLTGAFIGGAGGNGGSGIVIIRYLVA